MNFEVARGNYEVLRTLPPNTKLRVEDSKLVQENRWFTSGRRYWEQTSKLVLNAITDTFTLMKQEHNVLDVFANTEQKLKMLYPDNADINQMLQNILDLLASPPANNALAAAQIEESAAQIEESAAQIEESAAQIEEAVVVVEEPEVMLKSNNLVIGESVLTTAENDELKCILDEEAYVAPLRQRSVNLSRYAVVSGDIILDMGEESYLPNEDEECCLVKWFRDLFLINEKQD